MWESIEERGRVNFFPGRLLTADDLAREQAAARERQWLHNRALHGYGVATGFGVTVEGDSVEVSPGLAIDALGREIVLTSPRCLDASSVVHESHGRVQVVIAWAEVPADEVTGPDGPVPGRFVERPRLSLVEHAIGDAPEHAVPLARLYRRGDGLVADPSVRRHVHLRAHQGVNREASS